MCGWNHQYLKLVIEIINNNKNNISILQAGHHNA